jgi:hypothetical protein
MILRTPRASEPATRIADMLGARLGFSGHELVAAHIGSWRYRLPVRWRGEQSKARLDALGALDFPEWTGQPDAFRAAALAELSRYLDARTTRHGVALN